MRWLNFTNIAMNQINGKKKDSEPWISVEEIIRDSGKRKGIKMMDMEITVVNDHLDSEMLYLHFKGDKPETGIRIGWISED